MERKKVERKSRQTQDGRRERKNRDQRREGEGEKTERKESSISGPGGIKHSYYIVLAPHVRVFR